MECSNKLIVLTLLVLNISSILSQTSPCPRLFRYLPKNPNQPDRWYGEVLITSDVELIDGVFIVLVFDKTSFQLGSTFGEQIIRKAENEYLLRNLGYKLDANVPLVVKFFIRYDPREAPPVLTAIRLNARPYCPEIVNRFQEEFVTSKPALLSNNANQEELALDLDSEYKGQVAIPGQTQGNYPQENTPPQNAQLDTSSKKLVDVLKILLHKIEEGDGGNQNNNQEEHPFNVEIECGVVPIKPVGLIANGKETAQGEWPWHVAIIKVDGAQYQYICGGTLISNMHVLTAAHCVTHRPTNSQLSPESITLLLGKNNLRYLSKEEQQRDIENIVVHPNFNETGLKNDIAILKLSNPAKFTDYVRPICLWQENPSLERIVNRKGVVVGWGLDENKKISTVLRKVEVPVIPTTQCILSNVPFFSNVISDKNYCAGFNNATSVCNGDSGGGMFFPVAGSDARNPKWQIRGLVSIGVGNQGYRSVCDSNEYTVFTDVAKFMDWIQYVVSRQ